ncbi:MAG TPA: FKBP-type peptidyl-prolyl cis-trans isomerase [Flavobacteriaceae bacterium]|nr:FKBP-type peptidyl-prolyl cis-trans isomerase [Flavobacteriaceae bacterium]
MKKFLRFIFLGVVLTLCPYSCQKNNQNETKFIKTESGLKYLIVKEGIGNPVEVGQEVLIQETMSYRNDSLLFDSRNLPSPVKVLVGGSQAIKGVDEGLVGMKKGEIKILIVPPNLSKRSGNSTFPHPDSTLVYEIELIDILN